MTDDTAARLRALAERAKAADDAADRAEMEGARHDEVVAANSDAEDATQDFRNAANYDAILALLDAVEALRRERDEARNTIVDQRIELAALVQRTRDERDAAMALLREARDELRGMHDRISFRTDPPNEVVARIDALLDDGREAGR